MSTAAATVEPQVEKELLALGGLHRLLLVRSLTHYAREEVPEMLNITPATAEATAAKTADAYALQAATRPLAGFGAGAFTCEGAWADSRTHGMVAALALPRIKPASGATSSSGAQAGVAGAAAVSGAVGSVLADTRLAHVQEDIFQAGIAQADTDNFIQMTRMYPVTPGGVGPHPAREPVPV
jgi:hypothetical protein